MAARKRPINLRAPYLKRVWLDSTRVTEPQKYPFVLPFLRDFDLTFDHAIIALNLRARLHYVSAPRGKGMTADSTGLIPAPILPSKDKLRSDDVSEPETYDFRIEPIPNAIDLFELTLPLPPQGTWRSTFNIYVDVRFAFVDLVFGQATIRVRTRGARLRSFCTGCHLLPHSLYGLNPLPPRNLVAVHDSQTIEIEGSGNAQARVGGGVLQGIDASASLEATVSGASAHRVEKQVAREESVSRVTPRPHGVWDISEPFRPDRSLDGDYLTSRGQYLDQPSRDPTDLPLATVQVEEQADDVSVKLTIEVQPSDLDFTKLTSNENRAVGSAK